MRKSLISRQTKETDIVIEFSIDGGEVNAETGIGFFDHMLTAFGVHGNFGLTVTAKGDLEVDCHHTVEDTGIVLGQAFKKALGSNSGIKRYGTFFVPMDESLSMTSLDISNRPFLSFESDFPQEIVGDFDACMCKEFFRAFAENAGITLHIKCYGENSHHMIEAIFKSTAHALKEAVEITGDQVLSTKGTL